MLLCYLCVVGVVSVFRPMHISPAAEHVGDHGEPWFDASATGETHDTKAEMESFTFQRDTVQPFYVPFDWRPLYPLYNTEQPGDV